MAKNASGTHRSWQTAISRRKYGFDDFGDDPAFGHWYTSGYRSGRIKIDPYEAVKPLIRHLEIYDRLRQKIERQGGIIEELEALIVVLTQKICLEGYFGKTSVALTDPTAVRSALYDIDDTLRLQARELRSGMTGYYICRIVDIYYADFNSLIVEDLYCSPGYPMPDKRFVRLMRGGRETSFLRLSPYRSQIEKRIEAQQDPEHPWEAEPDQLQYDLGRYVLNPAWHEDQYPGMHAADHFELRKFPQAIELLYMELSGELCELRGQLDPKENDILQSTVSHPFLFGFLKMLEELNGTELNELPKEGLIHYINLQKAFSEFLGIEIPWGRHKTKMSLNTLLLSNFSRLDLVGKALKKSETALEAKRQLEATAQKIMRMATQKG
ncbi:hypothetical protein DSCO28_12280 [Desulfosarcina ovata subsp. sediminis]|uniref:Uncharacterized protein n=1 Tax=Desulfosarcina ovata subsp. sediminis TaxID=885957 RepID=A0A5K7ZF23_9BACT|nr:hypothetical protein [Desulfosarcina ovata]BBO80662.1 hypothetical protein DSCO28_12280 [Desulfosarcina ovata subsp. sediminis]